MNQRNDYLYIEHICGECCNHIELTVEFENISDYYLLDTECPHCGSDLTDSKGINAEIVKSINDYYVGKSDYECDNR